MNYLKDALPEIIRGIRHGIIIYSNNIYNLDLSRA